LSTWDALEPQLLGSENSCSSSEEDGMSLNGAVEGEREAVEWGREDRLAHHSRVTLDLRMASEKSDDGLWIGI